MRNRQLTISLRKNRGRQLFDEFITDLKQNLGVSEEVAFLFDLEKTDLIWALVKTKLNSCRNCSSLCFQKSWKNSEITELHQIIFKLKESLSHTELVLFRPLSEFCGAVKHFGEDILDHAFQLASLDQDELIVASEDASIGIVLSHDTEQYDTGDVETYELIVWGDDLLKTLGVM